MLDEVDAFLTAEEIVISSSSGLHMAVYLRDVTDAVMVRGSVGIMAEGGALGLEAPRAQIAPFVKELKARRLAETSMQQRLAREKFVQLDGDTVHAKETIAWAGARDGLTSPVAPLTARDGTRIRIAAVGFIIGIILAVPLGLLAPYVVGFFYAWITDEFSSGPYALPQSAGRVIAWIVWVALPPALAFLGWKGYEL